MAKATNQPEPGAGSPYRTAGAPVRRRPGSFGPDDHVPMPLRVLAMVVLALVLWVTMIAWREHRLKKEILALPAAERYALFSHTMDELRSVCSVLPGLREHCRQQAELVLRFPECDDDCGALADRFLDHARR